MPPGDAAAAPEGATDQANAPEGNQQSNPVRELLDRFIGLRIAGGCEHCDAYQTIERLDVGCYVNHVHHDDWCPWWLRYQEAAS